MIRALWRVIGTETHGRFRLQVALIAGYSIVQGVVFALLVPLLRALLEGDTGTAGRWLLVLAVAVVVTGVVYYLQAMTSFGIGLHLQRTMQTRIANHVATLPLGWFTGDRVGPIGELIGRGTSIVVGVPVHQLLVVLAGFLTPGGAADFGWFAYAPLNSDLYSPGLGGDLWVMGLALSGFGTIFGAVNFTTTIICMRAPGMTMFRMPIFTWNILVTAILVLIAFPLLAAALFALFADRNFGTHIFDPSGGGAVLWQHLFWFFGHPEVYIIALPFFGIITEVIPVFSRKPLFGYKGMIYATLAIGGLSVAVWAHHMYVTNSVNLPFFAFMTMLIAVPTGVKFFTWIGTMWRGSLTFEPPMLFAIGFLVTFLLGGLTGVVLASPPLDFQVSDSYFVVAHFHYVVFGTVVFAMFAGFYFWWPKMTGRMLDNRLGTIHFWMLFIGFHTTFLVQHWLGVEGMPRRYSSYLPEDGFTTLNQVSTVGAFILAISTLPFLWNVWKTRLTPKVTVDDPWGWGGSLEWATSCPPPRHNFTSIPRIRSERPAFDLKYPEVAALTQVPSSHFQERVIAPDVGDRP
jgi:cytochrome c oxidase subunit 1